MAEVKKDYLTKEERKERKDRRLLAVLLPVKITEKEIKNLGGTEQCEGCEFHVKEGAKLKPHSSMCRLRFHRLINENT